MTLDTPQATTHVELDYSGGERLTMNMGPQHPSAHGVFRAILTLEGETVVGVDAVIGYLHRCHEKLAEDRKSTRLNSSHGYISYAVFCLTKKKQINAELQQIIN